MRGTMTAVFCAPLARRSALTAAILTALCASSSPAFAQQAGAAAPALAAAEFTQLESVIVTGTHARDRTELNSTAPVDILSAEDLRAAAGAEANLGQALQALLPSFGYLDQSNSGSADHVRAGQLRGLSPDQMLVLINGRRVHPTSIVNVESVIGLGSVAVDFASIPVNAIKRVEVLRDGAGAQYGSDALAGVVNIILDDAHSGGELQLNTGLFHTHFAPTERTLNDGQTVNVQGKYGLSLGDGGFVRAGVDATHHNPTNRSGFDQFNPNYPAQNLITFQTGDARIKNLNLWLNASEPLAEGASLYGQALFNRRTSSGGAFFRESNDPNNIASVYPNGFLPRSTGTNEDWHLSGGARGQLTPAWAYDAALTYGRNTFQYGLENSLNSSLGPTSPTSFNLGAFRFSQTSANLDFTGDLGNLGLLAASTLAFGTELRRESYASTAGDPASYTTGTYGSTLVPPVSFAGGAQGDAGLQPADVADVSRTVGGAYADLSGNLLSSVFVDAAVRLDHFSDAGSSSTGKLSGRWEFAPRWALRGALSNNFRAPALAQIWSAYAPTAYGNGGGLSTINILPVSDPRAQALGAQPLKPEKSHNVSLGLTAQPVERLQLSADLFRINIDDRIILSQQIYAPAAVYQFFTNAVDTSTKGAELVGNWSTPLLGGNLHVSDASAWLSNTIRGVHAAPPALLAYGGALVGPQSQSTVTNAVPKRRDVVTVGWSGNGAAGSWNFLGRLTHTGEVTRVFDFGPVQTYGSTVQLDLEAEVRATRDLSLALGLDNLTDRYPTQSDSAINYGGNLPYDFLSPIGMNGRYVYLRLRYEIK